jgi:hypothetical protein
VDNAKHASREAHRLRRACTLAGHIRPENTVMLLLAIVIAVLSLLGVSW